MAGSRQQPNPFSLAFPGGPIVNSSLEIVCGLRKLKALYDRVRLRSQDRPFLDTVIEEHGLSIEVSKSDLRHIPASGPAVLVANHPYGVLEGMILATMLRQIRPDVRILTNSLLRILPELDDICIYVNPFGGGKAKSENLNPLRAAMNWLREGGMLVIHPAGEVASFNWRRMAVIDPPWNDTAARLAIKTGAVVVPVFFPGRNRLRFQLAGMIHPNLRTVLLPREFLAHRGKKLRMTIGSPINPAKLATLESTKAAIACVRERVNLLASRNGRHERAEEPKRPRTFSVPVAPSVGADVLAREIKKLPKNQTLLTNGDWKVFYARAEQFPNVMREIGRLRELTFRAIGEGTGRGLDLDRFDPHYSHLCVWHEGDRELAGAYRVGHTDEILPKHGAKGLYTSTLFKFHPSLLEMLTPGLELGRSFVTEQYQRSPALSLLWKGLGQYVLRHPENRLLFGPVSITNDYRQVSREIMVRHLKKHNYLTDLAGLVKPKRDFRPRFSGRDLDLACRLLESIEDVSGLVADIEADQKGIPVLLRHYLRLGAKIVGFNVDPEFGNALDGLIICDLALADQRILSRYMGSEDAAAFVERHSGKASLMGKRASAPCPSAVEA